MFVDSHCHLDCLDLSSYLTPSEFQSLAALETGPGQPSSHESSEERSSDRVVLPKEDLTFSKYPKAAMQALENGLLAAAEQGVEQFLCVCIDLEKSDHVLAIARQFPQVMATIGVHPLYKDSMEPTVEQLVQKVVSANQTERVVVAVGETGLDYHYCPEQPAWQMTRFETHLQAALEVQLPLIIHTRAAKQATLDRLRAFKADQVGGIMHCFTEDVDMAKQCIDMGFYISVSGIITFNNASALREVVAALPLDRLLIETDSPYLAPKPYRGKSNEPKFVVEVAKKVAAIKGVSVEEVAEVTTGNYRSLFQLPESPLLT